MGVAVLIVEVAGYSMAGYGPTENFWMRLRP